MITGLITHNLITLGVSFSRVGLQSFSAMVCSMKSYLCLAEEKHMDYKYITKCQKVGTSTVINTDVNTGKCAKDALEMQTG